MTLTLLSRFPVVIRCGEEWLAVMLCAGTDSK